jgi:hypothetical protein
MASRHPLLANCLECGRIVCEVEGRGPCTFCGLYLIGATAEEQRAHAAKVRFSGSVTDAETSAAALANRDQMLQHQLERAKRTIVLDDQCDYYTSDSNWLSEDERAAALAREQAEREARHGSRIGAAIKVSFDFEGRQIVDDAETERLAREKQMREAMRDDVVGGGVRCGANSGSSSSSSSSSSNNNNINNSGSINTNTGRFSGTGGSIVPAPAHSADAGRPAFIASDEFLATIAEAARNEPRPRARLVQHEDELARPVSHEGDVGRTLSMHQPWAGLLVAGVKRVEGRTWSTDFRGRLWIASTVQEPDPSVITDVEDAFREQWRARGELAEMPTLPHFYPCGVLLGFVEVVDVIETDELDEGAAPPEENDSPFLFVCERPRELLVPMRVTGAHKIWKMDKNTLIQAQRAIDLQVG